MEANELADLLIETAMRSNLMFPQTEKQDEWFEAGTNGKTEDGKDFYRRLSKALRDIGYDNEI